MSEWLTPSRRWSWSPLLVSDSPHSKSSPGYAWDHRSLVYLVDMRLKAAPTMAELVTISTAAPISTLVVSRTQSRNMFC